VERLGMLVGEIEEERPELRLTVDGAAMRPLALQVLRLLRSDHRGQAIAADIDFADSAQKGYERAKRELIPRVLVIEPVDGSLGRARIRDLAGGHPVRTRLQACLDERFLCEHVGGASTLRERP
jgi:hypothetical protein